MATSLINLPALWNSARQRDVPAIGNPDGLGTRTRLPSLNLSSILDEYSPFPPYSLVIGLCSDGYPFMLSLDNPKSGSILVVGGNKQEKSQLLKTMSDSACRINNPSEVTWCVISQNARQYSHLMTRAHCQAVINPYDRASGELVVELASIVEQRRVGRELGGTMVLMIDDFQSFVPMLSDYNVYLNLKTLVTQGPASGIWPLISIEPDDVHSERGQLLRLFGTYIFEKVDHQPDYTPSARPARSPDQTFQPNFNAIIGGRLIPICSLSN